MGAGTDAAGLGLAGLDVYAGTGVTVHSPLKAPLYDPAIRGFAIDIDGEILVEVHPVVQKAIMLIGFREGAIPSASTMGLRLTEIRKATADNVQAVAEDAVKLAWKNLIADKDIKLVGVEVERDPKGRTSMLATFSNLREPGTPPVVLRRSV